MGVRGIRVVVAALVIGVAIVGSGLSWGNDYCSYPPYALRRFPLNCHFIDPCLDTGRLLIQVRVDQDVYSVVRDHGGTAANVRQSSEGPFDDIDREVGVDRFYHVTVSRDQARRRAQEYRFDRRIEHADLDSGRCLVYEPVHPMLAGKPLPHRLPG